MSPNVNKLKNFDLHREFCLFNLAIIRLAKSVVV
jgi:hypothetical protein